MMRTLIVPCAAVLAACTASGARQPVLPEPSPAPVVAAPDLPRDQTADQQVRHVLGRLAYGARPGDVERVRALGVDRWIALQLEPSRIENRETEHLLTRFPSLALDAGELMRAYPPPQLLRAQQRREMRRSPGDSAGRAMLSAEDSMALRQAQRHAQRVLAEMQIAKVVRAVSSERQLEEVMVDFWENHFTVFAGKGPERYLIGSYDRETIRPRALGRFRDLLGAVAKSPAMLFYLDNWQSSVEPGRPVLECGLRTGDCGSQPARRGRRSALRSPQPAVARPPRGLNENYARELLELHTLGVDGGYTQQDVVNVARALTGWTLQQPRAGGGFVFRPAMHDAGEKFVLGQRLRPGRGIDDGEQVLDIVAGHPSTARFIATKLARRFVSDEPPAALVDRAAEAFRRTDGDIREVVRVIVTSPEFFSAEAYRAKVKSPFELVVSALRALGAEPDTTPRTAMIIARLGQPLFMHQTPNGYPETGAAWINTGAILNRINFGLATAAGRIPGARIERWPPAARLASAPRPEQVDGVIAALLGGQASPDTRRILEQGENPLAARATSEPAADSVLTSSAMGAPGDDRPARLGGRRNDPLGRPVSLDGLAEIIGLALGAPEFQRR